MLSRNKEKRENSPIVLWNGALIEGARAWQVLLKIYRFILALLNYLRGAFNLDLINIKVNRQLEGPHRIRGRCSICARENADDMIRLIDSRLNDQIYSPALVLNPVACAHMRRFQLRSGEALGRIYIRWQQRDSIFEQRTYTLGHAWLYAVDIKYGE